MITTDEPISGKRFVYDLYGVANHFGSLNGGHYTAFVKNPMAAKWYEFDDNIVNKLGRTPEEIYQTVMTKSAYVLFYKLRK